MNKAEGSEKEIQDIKTMLDRNVRACQNGRKGYDAFLYGDPYQDISPLRTDNLSGNKKQVTDLIKRFQAEKGNIL